MKKLSILIPSRKRVELLKETLLSIETQTSNKNQIEIIFGIDIDDLDTKKFLNEYQKESNIIPIGENFRKHVFIGNILFHSIFHN